MTPLTIIALVLALAGTAINIIGGIKKHSSLQDLGTLIVIISVAMAVINKI